jgi:hypothetical protein
MEDGEEQQAGVKGNNGDPAGQHKMKDQEEGDGQINQPFIVYPERRFYQQINIAEQG